MRVHSVFVHGATDTSSDRFAYIGGANAFAQQGADDVQAIAIAHAQTHAVTDARADALALPRQVSFAFAHKRGALALADKAHDAVTVQVSDALAFALSSEQGALELAQQIAHQLDAYALAHRGQAHLCPNTVAHQCALEEQTVRVAFKVAPELRADAFSSFARTVNVAHKPAVQVAHKQALAFTLALALDAQAHDEANQEAGQKDSSADKKTHGAPALAISVGEAVNQALGLARLEEAFAVADVYGRDGFTYVETHVEQADVQAHQIALTAHGHSDELALRQPAHAGARQCPDSGTGDQLAHGVAHGQAHASPHCAPHAAPDDEQVAVGVSHQGDRRADPFALVHATHGHSCSRPDTGPVQGARDCPERVADKTTDVGHALGAAYLVASLL